MNNSYDTLYSLLPAIQHAIFNNDVALLADLLSETTLDRTSLLDNYAPPGSAAEAYLLKNGASATFLALEAMLNDDMVRMQHFLMNGADAQKLYDTVHLAWADSYGKVHVPLLKGDNHLFTYLHGDMYWTEEQETWVRLEGDRPYTTKDAYTDLMDSELQPYLPVIEVSGDCPGIEATLDTIESTLVMPVSDIVVVA